jgi:hypothetical protein
MSTQAQQPQNHWVMDLETIVNCFVGVFQHYKDDQVRHIFIIHEDRNDFPKLLSFLSQCVTHRQWHISYNGLAFDAQICQWMLDNGKRLSTLDTCSLVTEIYNYAQSIISKRDRNEFLDYSPKKLKIRQIDLFKMNHWDNKAKMSSLKWIQYSMDWDNVEEMPHPHYEPVEDQQTLHDIVKYCLNDVLSTKKILEHSKEQIQLRQTLTKEYNIDLYSASEPRISKELFLHFLEQKTGIPKFELKQRRTPRPYIILADCILPYVSFETPVFKQVLDYFRKTVITSTKDGFKYSIDFMGVKTDYGLGGIHGAAPAGVYKALPGWTIMTSDVTSFYPNLAIENGFAPAHIPAQEFGELYKWFFEERKKIPKSDPRNYVYKIILNSTYGLSGDENSFLYDPKFTMQITINGQLLLSKLYEMLIQAIPDAKPLMQNTDGLEMMIPTDKVETYMKVCGEWEKLTRLQLEHDQYKKMVIRDVNNYIAINVKDKVKCKGAFEWEDLDQKKVAVFHKNKSFLVIPKAIYQYFVNGVKPEDYLAQNKNIQDYCAGVKAKGGWYYENRYIDNGTLKADRLQKIVRYYISNNGGKMVKCHPDGREIQVESGEWMQTVVNKLQPDQTTDNFDINYKYYLEEIYKQIEGIEKDRHTQSTQLTLF